MIQISEMSIGTYFLLISIYLFNENKRLYFLPTKLYFENHYLYLIWKGYCTFPHFVTDARVKHFITTIGFFLSIIMLVVSPLVLPLRYRVGYLVPNMFLFSKEQKIHFYWVKYFSLMKEPLS